MQTGVRERIDRFEIASLVHRGAMATVYKATDTSTGETVALKIPDLSFGARPQFYDAFRREAALLKELDHPGIVRFKGRTARTGTTWLSSSWTAWTCGEYFAGKRPFLSPGRRRSASPCAKPSPIFTAEESRTSTSSPRTSSGRADGRLVLVDFGLARTEGKREIIEDRATAGLPQGTPDYASPEQVAGKEADFRSDIYSLGVLLFEAVTGRLPFSGRTPEARARRRLHLDPIPPRFQARPAARLARADLESDRREPAARFQKAEDLARSLRNPLTVPLTSRAARMEPRALGDTVRAWFRSLIGRSL